MAIKKLYDMAVKVSSYTDRDGNNKNRYENIGTMLEGDNGPFLLLKRTFNPAGVPTKDGSDTILVSLFEPREDDNQRSGQGQQRSGGQQERRPPQENRNSQQDRQRETFAPDLDDEIPF